MTIIEVLAKRTVELYNQDRFQESDAIYSRLSDTQQKSLLDAVIALVGPLLEI